MTTYSRARRKRLVQEAEGYFDLLRIVTAEFPGGASSSMTFGPTFATPHQIPMARRAFEALERLEPGDCRDGRAHFLRGQALRLMGRYREAIDSLTRAVRCDPHNVRVFLAMAWCYKRMGRLDLAIESLEDALEVDSERAVVHYNLACYWSLTNNVGLTLAHLNRAFELNLDYRRLTANEPDFEPVRHHPEFLALTQAIV